MATGRQKHPAPAAEESDAPATAKERMAAKVRTPAGRALYAESMEMLGETKKIN